MLKFILFKETASWDVKQYLSKKINSIYPVEKLGKHILLEKKKIKPFELPEDDFGILGISNEIGMFDAYTEKGRNINQPYTIVNKDFLAYNPYRVNVGSIGIKNSSLVNGLISPAYVVFSCKDTLLPEYLFLLMKSDTFNRLICENTTGSVRQTLSFTRLADLSVPVPPIAIQKRIVLKYNETITRSDNCFKSYKELNNLIEQVLFDELGIIDASNIIYSSGQLLKTTSLSQSSRWSVDFLLNQHKINFIKTSKYKLVSAKHFILECQYGLSDKASLDESGVPVLRMNNIQDSEIVIDDLKYLPNSTKNIQKYLLKKGDILFNRTNSKELVGKTAIFEFEEKCVFASYLIRVVINDKVADKDYVNILFASKILRTQIDLVSRQILGQANINAEELKELIFPLPPLETQTTISSMVLELNSQAKSLRLQATELRQIAKKEFEDAVFGGDSL